MDRAVPAGFYSTGWGLIPFSFSTKESERLAVHQVDYFVAELPFARVEGDFSAQPWPGYLTLGGQTLLALMVEPGTTVKYPWNLDVPAVISLACGLSPAQSGEDGNGSFEFRVMQRGPRGEILAVDSAVPDGHWRRLELALKAHGEGGRSLELLFTSHGGAGKAIGAFAAPKLEAH